ncbi:inosine/xanthosine triphosphatase [Candidatus Woesearchaeota archaeon]|nr:inosine/xanthosine triphosphatase [Candidatus Woesearchaeota archaeon]
MLITIGSTNPVKVAALTEILGDYPLFAGAEIMGIAVPSGVAAQPMTEQETMDGAMNRARAAYRTDYSFGVESGLKMVPYGRTGYMNFVTCAAFDGREFYLGQSSAFELPIEVINLVLRDGIESGIAFHTLGLTASANLKHEEGTIGILTNGRITRKEYLKEAIRNALILIENKPLYNRSR